MPRQAPELECPAEDKASLVDITKSRIEEARAVERARIILACLEGKEIQQVARELGVSIPTVTKWRRRFALWGVRGLRDLRRRVLRREGIHLQRHRSWCGGAEKEFAPKAADVGGLSLTPPLNAVVLSVDEKPSIQAIERPSGYVETDSGAIVRALKSTYKR